MTLHNFLKREYLCCCDRCQEKGVELDLRSANHDVTNLCVDKLYKHHRTQREGRKRRCDCLTFASASPSQISCLAVELKSGSDTVNHVKSQLQAGAKDVRRVLSHYYAGHHGQRTFEEDYFAVLVHRENSFGKTERDRLAKFTIRFGNRRRPIIQLLSPASLQDVLHKYGW